MSSFYASLAPEPFRVLGVKLKRLTFGHVVLLERFGCNPIKSALDLVTAVQICSRDYAGALRYVDSLSTRWRGALNWWFLRRLKKLDLERSTEAWGEYIKANSLGPDYAKAESSQPSKLGAPATAQIRAYLLGRCGYSPDTIMDHFYGQCLWDFGAAFEQQVGEGIVGDRHAEIARILGQENA